MCKGTIKEMQEDLDDAEKIIGKNDKMIERLERELGKEKYSSRAISIEW